MTTKIRTILTGALGAVAMLTAPLDVSAREASSDDGNELLSQCNDEGYYLQGVCMGIVKGTINTLDAWSIVNKTSPYCRPDNATWGQMQDVIVSYLKRHPEIRSESASLLILKAQREAWPCAKDVT
ncbi:hypothetical protein UFOVP36_45 [uncultured Caudovirales phage]|uniref:Rap1a immunity protein domain-containing protein n=1 Tax=uncultured Caudovirales phage TaxID=2100421 RepID=A0A6J5KLZ1_9CAUD|nr:hypothetical protein UFOVP36_45 [uncultured Caudovirales phage]